MIGELVDPGPPARVRGLFEDREVAVAAAPRGLTPGDVVSADGDDVERLAPAGSALAALWGVLAHHGVDPTFPGGVRDEVAAIAAAPGIADPELDDLTGVAFCTIDEVHSRDLDQAVHVARDGDGHLVSYALADAAHFVRRGTALFEDALGRGASHYLPGLVTPMLPRVLSEDLVSLNPAVDRRALVFRMRLDSAGVLRDTEVVRGRIHSRAKLAFDQVQQFLDGDTGAIADRDVAASLRLMAEVGERRLRLGEERDIVRFRRTEVEVHLGDGGMTFVAEGDLRTDVERYNEQVSLLCNIEGARYLAEGDDATVQAIYRVHDGPERRDLRDLGRTVAAIARAHGRPGLAWDRGRHSLAEYLRELPRDGDDGRIARAIHRQALYINGRSAYSARPGGHFGVGADRYARFSAPMREIVGIFLHGEALERMTGHGGGSRADDEALRERVIEAASDSRRRQRQLTGAANRLILDRVFARELAREPGARETWPGTVVGLARGKVHVLLDEPPIDVKVYVRHLSEQLGERLDLARGEIELVRRGGGRVVRVGDAVRLEVRGRDEHDRWVLGLTG